MSATRASGPLGRGVLWALKDKRTRGRALSPSQKKRKRKYGAVRAKVAHVFPIIKCQFEYRRVRYRGLAKTAAQMFPLTALAIPLMVREKLMPDSA